MFAYIAYNRNICLYSRGWCHLYSLYMMQFDLNNHLTNCPYVAERTNKVIEYYIGLTAPRPGHFWKVNHYRPKYIISVLACIVKVYQDASLVTARINKNIAEV